MQASSELLEARKRVEALADLLARVEFSPGGVVLGANPKFVEALGFDSETELIGKDRANSPS